MRKATAVLALGLVLVGCGKVDQAAESAKAAAEAAALLPPEAYEATKLSAAIKRCAVKTCPTSSPNYVTVQVTVAQKNGDPPLGGFAVVTVFNRPGDTTTQQAECSEIAANDPTAKRGVYRCLGILSGPGKWTFAARLFRPGAPTDGSPIVSASTTLDIADAVKLNGERPVS
ncbi:MAG: hypothetical protein ACT4QG_04845 [Sporichthyaceae bacterium]